MSQSTKRIMQYAGRLPQMQYIPQSDRYLFASETPKYRFNVIGTGDNGSEHIRVTPLEGRATIHGVYDPNPGSIAMAKASFEKFAPGQALVV